MTEPTITLYTGQTANGVKISITLEELGLPYTVYKLNTSTQEQKSEWFTKINPNGRFPAITDRLSNGQEIRVFESGSIMQYLVDRYDTDYRISYPRGTQEHVEMTNWLFFQNAGIGPNQGSANHFVRYTKEYNEYAAQRYQNETKRLYGVLEKHLTDSGSEFLVGNKCTIADIAHWGWITLSRWAGIELAEFPRLQEWEERMFARPAVEKGRQVPDKHQREMLQDPNLVREFEERARAWYRQQESKTAEKEIEER